MKMRSSMASRGMCMASSPLELVEGGRREVAEPHRKEAEHEGQADVAPGPPHLAVADQGEGLQAERGEGGVAAAQADHHELPRFRPDQQATVWAGERSEEADDERADDVDDQRPPREQIAEVVRGEARTPV